MNNRWIITKILEFSKTSRITGVASARNGIVYITVWGFLYKIDTKIQNGEDGTMTGLTEGQYAPELHTVCWDSENDEVYVANDRDIFVYSTRYYLEGQLTKFNLNCRPRGMVVNNGCLYWTERHNTRKIQLNETTNCQIISGGKYWQAGYKNGKVEDALFRDIEGIAIDSYGSIYVADFVNQKIRVVEDGIVKTLADVKHKDPLNLSHPSGVAFGPHGTLYIADENYLRAVEIGDRKVTVKHAFKLKPDNVKEDLTGDHQYYCTGPTKKAHKVVATHVSVDALGTVYVSVGNTLWKLEKKWQVERFLWIAWLKEEPGYCQLAGVPKDVVKVISSFLH